MWIASRPNAFVTTFLAGLIAGFFLGVHAIRADIGPWMLGALVLVAIIGEIQRRRAPVLAPMQRVIAPASTPVLATVSSPTPSRDEIEDAQAALASLGYSVREARSAVASALTTLDEDATASVIVRAALRARGR